MISGVFSYPSSAFRDADELHQIGVPEGSQDPHLPPEKLLLFGRDLELNLLDGHRHVAAPSVCDGGEIARLDNDAAGSATQWAAHLQLVDVNEATARWRAKYSAAARPSGRCRVDNVAP